MQLMSNISVCGVRLGGNKMGSRGTTSSLI